MNKAITITKDQLMHTISDISCEMLEQSDDPGLGLTIVMLNGMLFAKLATKLFDMEDNE